LIKKRQDTDGAIANYNPMLLALALGAIHIPRCIIMAGWCGAGTLLGRWMWCWGCE
jgi:hypothetical protein